MTLPIGGLLGSGEQSFAIADGFQTLSVWSKSTQVIDDVNLDVATGSIGIAVPGQTDRYQLDAQLQLFFPVGNSRVGIAFFRDDIQVADEIVVNIEGTTPVVGIIGNSFTWANVRMRNAANPDDFGVQDPVRVIFQYTRFHIQGLASGNLG